MHNLTTQDFPWALATRYVKNCSLKSSLSNLSLEHRLWQQGPCHFTTALSSQSCSCDHTFVGQHSACTQNQQGIIFFLNNLFELEGSNNTALPHNRQAALDHRSEWFYQTFCSPNIFLPKNIKLHNYQSWIRSLPAFISNLPKEIPSQQRKAPSCA